MIFLYKTIHPISKPFSDMKFRNTGKPYCSLIPAGIAAIAALLALASCNNAGGGYSTNAATGVQYHFYRHDEKGATPVMGDYAELMLTLKNVNDSVIYDAHHRRKGGDTSASFRMVLKKTYTGCLAQGLTMMAAGDSASFRISADSLYLKTFRLQALPPYIKAGSFLTVYVKLISFETPEQLQASLDRQIKEREAEMAKLKAAEQPEIEKYLSDNKLKIKPESDGIYILERAKGKGKSVKSGDSVEVKYTCTLLDGTLAESSEQGGGKNTFTLVFGHNHFIKGFDDIIANLEEGGRVKALIPSSLAYGNQTISHLIVPYTPLIYNVEIIHIK